ncbi:MAG: 4'-phosphopantetheinyl transferase superfamily protein [Chthoniobacterales bacterium]|nr:4'-phosphopantetheinyl transferase superfamily protein [Chthoniobacterales bacterium]
MLAETAVNPTVRIRHVVARGLRRKLLSDLTGRPADALVFVGGEGSKPRLRMAGELDFNTSHAGDYVVVAAGTGGVGIDLEQIREVREMEGIVRRYFHPDEVAAWTALESAARMVGFFILWCAREAAMKCFGIGLARGIALTRIDPAILTEAEAEATVDGAELRVRVMDAPRGYVMVLARG